MTCGLFSSFDPGIFSENVFSSSLNIKWISLLCLFLLMSWQVYPSSLGSSFTQKLVSSFLLSSIKDIFPSPNKVIIILSSLFLFIFFMNLWGLVPFFFSLSSHISINLSLSIPLWMGGVLFSIVHSFGHFLAHVVPLGSPPFLWPLLVVVESVSLLIRPFTLSIRLMANVMAGHLIMSLMGEFFSMGESMIPLSMIFLGFFLSFEMCISIVQAYVFMSLLSLYWKEGED